MSMSGQCFIGMAMHGGMSGMKQHWEGRGWEAYGAFDCASTLCKCVECLCGTVQEPC
jgi:hypothetical protein